MPPTQPNEDAWLANQLAAMKNDIAALKARTATLASVTAGLFVPARAYRAAAMNVGTSATKIPVDAVTFDPGGYFDTTTNHRYNAPAAGYYVAIGVFGMAATDGSGVVALIEKNGTTMDQDEVLAGASGNGTAVVVDMIECAAGDYLELFALSGTAGALTVGSANTYFAVIRIA